MPITGTGSSLTSGNRPWWRNVGSGLQSVLGNFTFSSGPNGFAFGGYGGGTEEKKSQSSTNKGINAWLPYVVGGAVLLKLFKK